MYSSSRSGRYVLPMMHSRGHIVRHARHFSASAPKCNSVGELVVAGPLAVIEGIHSFGIPWCATIPLTAVLVRGVLVYYSSHLPRRKKAQIRLNLSPLIWARTRVRAEDPRYRTELRELAKTTSSSTVVRHRNILRWEAHIIERLRVGWVFGTLGQPHLLLFNLFMLISTTEAIRLKSGSSTGLLSVILSPLEWIARKAFPQKFTSYPSVESQVPTEMPAAGLETARDEHSSGIPTIRLQSDGTQTSQSHDNAPANGSMASVSDSQALSSLEQETLNPHFDPSLQLEGFQWCQDLTLPDPTLYLPAALVVVLISSRLLRPNNNVSTKAPPRNAADGSGASSAPIVSAVRELTTFQRLGIVFAGLFGYLSTSLPAAVQLYLISSYTIGWLQAIYLDVRYPITPGITACARPLRNKVKQRSNDAW